MISVFSCFLYPRGYIVELTPCFMISWIYGHVAWFTFLMVIVCALAHIHRHCIITDMGALMTVKIGFFICICLMLGFSPNQQVKQFTIQTIAC